MPKIGIFGGTFNPVHSGHLAAAKEARKKLKLKKIIFIPGGLLPHKKNQEIALSNHRYEMVKLAIKGKKYFEVSPMEIYKKAISYSIETILALKKKYQKNTELVFLLGADAMLNIKTWKQPRKVLKLCHFFVLKRAGYPISDMIKKLAKIKIYKDKDYKVLNIKSPDISSTEIRKLIKNGLDTGNFIPKEVKKYIHEHRLYQ